MTENIKVVNTRTMLGWNPLTKDFKNLSFILSFFICYIVSLMYLPILFLILFTARLLILTCLGFIGNVKKVVDQS